ncbi:Thioesterase/thiol ester dehydrase-isomerase [Hesseltinella vesiculosa]|uniref:Thioesterase/thiol ester dehydrase-isomerase n=1 Tax=Hesseltinella vesiculosa TaxID=101127 RepID=A0A1X2GHK7_9FUNG|nr:Thioesterase/thiol ester dehydrase-isomerase [Hesseltinella vesiculosa]
MNAVTSAFEAIRAIWIRAFLYITEPVFSRLLPDPYTNAGHTRVPSKLMKESKVTMTEIVTSSHCNSMGICFAGTTLGWIDIAAGICAKRHGNAPSVTRSVDGVAFLFPVKEGDILKIQASVNKSWRTSMEVGVRIEAESPLTTRRVFVAHAYLTFVALSPRPKPQTYLGRQFLQYQPTPVPQVMPETDLEKRRYDMAEHRRQQRLRHHPATPVPSTTDNIRALFRNYAQQQLTHQPSLPDEPAVDSHPAFKEHPEDLAEDNDDACPIRPRPYKRRYSVDPTMAQPVKFMYMKDTFAEVVKLVMPQHANTLGITFGGMIISWMEMCALSSANRLAKAYVVTASIDSLNFIRSTRIGDVITIRSMISRSYTSSMEVFVTVEAENLQTGETQFTNDGFFTITAVDRQLVPVIIPQVIPQTETEVQLHTQGDERRNKRLLYRQELIGTLDK